jgi:hypothetical protein
MYTGMSQYNGIKIGLPKKKFKGKKLTTPTSLWTSNQGNHYSPTIGTHRSFGLD